MSRAPSLQHSVPASWGKGARSGVLRWGRAHVPELVVVAAVLFAYHGTLLWTAHLPYDAELFHFPLVSDAQGLIARGTLPRWDNFTYGGIPLLANAQSAWLYPPHVVLGLTLSALGHPFTERLWDLLLVGHVVLAGIFTCLLARERGLRDAGVAYAGVVAVLCGAVVSQAEHAGMTEAFAWLPLAILFVDRLAVQVQGRYIVGLALCFALMITAGFLPVIPACALLIVASGLFRSSGRARAAGGTLLGVLVGILLAAGALLPGALLLGVFPPLPIHTGLATAGLLSAFHPNVFGHWQGTLAGYHGPGGITTSYYYLGGGALLLAALALVRGGRGRWELALIVLLLLATFGSVATSIAGVIQGMPIIGHLWRPEDVAFVTAIPVALFLGRALDRAPTGGELIWVAVVLIAVALFPVGDGLGRDVHLFSLKQAGPLLALGVTGVLLVLACLLRARPKLTAVLLGAVAAVGAVDLAGAVPGRYFVNSPGPATTAGPDSTGDHSVILAFLRDHLRPGERVALDVANLPAQWTGFPPIWRLSDVNGFQPQYSKYQLDRVRDLAPSLTSGSRIFPVQPALAPYLREMDARYIVVNPALDPFRRTPGYALAFSDSAYRVYRVAGSLSRAFDVSPTCLRQRGGYALLPCRTAAAPVVSIGPSTETLGPLTSQDSTLLITGEPWYPGWRADAITGPLAVSRVGYMAAVTVPKGVSRVTLSYDPPGLVAGSVVSVLALALCAALLVWVPRRRLSAGRPGKASASGTAGRPRSPR